MKRREKRGNISASLDSQKCKRERKSERRRRDRDRARERRNKTNQLTSPTGWGGNPGPPLRPRPRAGLSPRAGGVLPGPGVQVTAAPKYLSSSEPQPLPGLFSPSFQALLDQKDGWKVVLHRWPRPSRQTPAQGGLYGSPSPSRSLALGP